MAGSCAQTSRLRFPAKLAHFLVSNSLSPKLLKINTLYVNILYIGNELQFRRDLITKAWSTVSFQGSRKVYIKQSPRNLQQNFPEKLPAAETPIYVCYKYSCGAGSETARLATGLPSTGLWPAHSVEL